MFSPVSSSLEKNCILTGYAGPGQLALARRVAERLRLPFVDFALRFEATHAMSSDEARALYGEARQRSLEGELVAEMTLYRGTVIHVSGDTLLRGDFLGRLATTGPVLSIVASLDAVLQRLHLAMGARYHDPRERDMALGMIRREWAIRNRENIHEIDTSSLSDAETVETIAALWRTEAAVIDWRG